MAGEAANGSNDNCSVIDSAAPPGLRTRRGRGSMLCRPARPLCRVLGIRARVLHSSTPSLHELHAETACSKHVLRGLMREERDQGAGNITRQRPNSQSAASRMWLINLGSSKEVVLPPSPAAARARLIGDDGGLGVPTVDGDAGRHFEEGNDTQGDLVDKTRGMLPWSAPDGKPLPFPSAASSDSPTARW